MPTVAQSIFFLTKCLEKKQISSYLAKKEAILAKIQDFFITNSTKYSFRIYLMQMIQHNMLPEIFNNENINIYLKELYKNFEQGLLRSIYNLRNESFSSKIRLDRQNVDSNSIKI